MRLRIMVWLCLSGGISFAQDRGWTDLFQDGLNNWDTYLGPSYDTLKKDWDEHSVGLNLDPKKVFTLSTDAGKNVLRISGEGFGGISTKQEYKNYHLRFEFRWGTEKYHPKKNDKRDSGLLYHAVGNHGADYRFWMRSQEFQLQESDCGDYWGVAGGSFEIKARKENNVYVYDSLGTRMVFNEKSPVGRRCVKNPDAEKTSGEWNVAELYCFGGTAIHVMNGRVVMVLENSSQLDDGKLTPLTKGKIQLQSEGAEIFFRDMEISPIDQLPALR